MEITKEIREKIDSVKAKVGTYPDFPKPGIVFRDVFSVMRDVEAYRTLTEIFKWYSKRAIDHGVQVVVALDARGFIFGPQLALEIGVPFVPVRKKGKLPGKVISREYSLEYGKDALEIQEGSLQPGQKALIVDDLLATGGSLKTACELIKKMGGEVDECLVVLELLELKGRDHIPAPVISLIQY